MTTDGNTATTLVPSEEQMNQVADIFSKMRDSVIDASRLAGEVTELRLAVSNLKATTEDLRKDIEYYRERNASLDNALVNANNDLSQARAQLNQTTGELHKTMQERDDALLQVMHLEEELAKAKDKAAFWESNHNTVASHKDDLEVKLRAIQSVFNPVPAAEATPLPKWEDQDQGQRQSPRRDLVHPLEANG